ncbi:MAG: FHA domain-containing protein [Propionibacteriaceae bacterium]|nr:FHA domain-containing protein [Propionibacteriaceae bacterium]
MPVVQTAVEPAEAPRSQTVCPNCGSPRAGDALFCESCGYDYTTGALPHQDFRTELGLPPAKQTGTQTSGDEETGPGPHSAEQRGTDPSSTDQPDAPDSTADRTDPPQTAQAQPENASSASTPTTTDQPGPAGSDADQPSTGQPSTGQPDTEQSDEDSASATPSDEAEPAVTPPGADAPPADTAVPTAPAPGVPADPTDNSTGVSIPAPAERIRDSAPTGPVTRHVPHVAEIWVDPQWYAFQESADPMPPQGPPRIVVLRDSALIGRHSASRNIHPDIDCEPDVGCSRRQAYLTSADGYWYVNDLDSANGTFVAPATASLPTEPITTRTQISPDMRIYVGAWTRIVIRPAIQGETGV